jgi:AbiV family abortive infection protein
MTIAQIYEACTKILENAHELMADAELLLGNGRYPRAFTTAHLALEELAKLPVLHTLAIELARGRRVDWHAVDRRLRNHEVKIKGDILMDFLRTAHITGANVESLFQRLHGASATNDLKNQSLYATQISDTFIKPSDVITEEIARATLEHTRAQLQTAQLQASVMALATGGTEAGLRKWIETQEFQAYADVIEGIAGTSEEPVVTDQQLAQETMRELFANPAVQGLLAHYGALYDQQEEVTAPSNPNV